MKRPATSLHQRILADIQGRILSGQWPAGRRIPFEHELMKQYQCSRMTVSKVLTRLAQAGLIERRRKAGSFVRRPHSQSAVLDIPDIKAEVAALGLPYRHEILRRRRRRSLRAEYELFGSGTLSVLEVHCLHMAGRRPFCLEQRAINLLAVPEAADEPFEELAPGAWLLRRVPWTLAEHHIRAAAASPRVAAALKIKSGAPCLIVERTTRGIEPTITFVRLTYPGDLHQLVASFAPLAAVPAPRASPKAKG
ncbi:MAG: histidine utilization repressor [Steroidobacteraceae bacterium]